MKICGQTLILIDNDGTVSEVNQKIVKSTIKYMLYHAPEDRAFCISTYSHELEGEEEFSTDINDLLCKVDLLEFAAKDSNLTDVLTDRLTSWRNSDFACRDIVVFTDGLEGTSINYEDEELFYLIENTSYPIYIVDLVQDNNEMVRKHLSAIATTSEGKLYLSEFEGDDGGVDRQLSEGIYAAMDEYAKREWYSGEYDYSPDNTNENDGKTVSDSVEETSANGTAESNGNSKVSSNAEGNADGNENEVSEERQDEKGSSEYEADIIESDEYYSSGNIDEAIIYETYQEQSFYEKPEVVIGAILAFVILIILGFIGSMLFVKRRRKNCNEDREIEEMAQKNTIKDEFFGQEDEVDIFDEDFFGDDKEDKYKRDNESEFDNYNDSSDCGTRLLMPMNDNNGSTRLLTEIRHRIILMDVRDKTVKHELIFNNSIILGRSEAVSDYVIQDDSVSKKHCEFSCVEGHYYVKDLDSSNGTIVNGNKITSVMIKTNDCISLGEAKFTVRCL